MTTAEYLILITALLLVAAAMIYFRVVRRSRSKDVDLGASRSISFESAAISISDIGESEAFDDEPDDRVSLEVRLKNTDSVANDESEYLDDLEDAAAGLARLMNSSESNRVAFQEESPECPLDETADDTLDEEVPPVESVLSEEVVEQIGRIDFELDALEELVASIEESLEAFSSLGADDLPEVEETVSLAEAA